MTDDRKAHEADLMKRANEVSTALTRGMNLTAAGSAVVIATLYAGYLIADAVRDSRVSTNERT